MNFSQHEQNRIERMSYFLVNYILWPLVQLILALGSAICVTGKMLLVAGRMQAGAAIANDGPSPTSIQSSNMPQAKYTTFYNRVFMKHLFPKLNKFRLCTHMTMPEKSGQVFRNFMTVPLPANTNQQLEGTISNPVTVSVNFQDVIMGQWADYLNFSDKAFITSISDDLVNYRKNMAQRLALTLDDLVMVNLDYLRTLDSKTANQDVTVLTNSTYPFTKQQLEQMPASLLGQNVQPHADGFFHGSVHPFFVGDLTALDTGNSSIVDIWKHTTEGQMKLEALSSGPEEDSGVPVIELFGTRWMTSTNQTQYPAWQSSGLTALSTYLTGEDAMVVVTLPRPKGTNIAEGHWQGMTLWAGEYSQGNSYDPARVIAAGTSYNVILGVAPPPDTTSRARICNAVPQTT